MNSIQINCFLEAARQKSFSKAAAKLFISQPTFSRNISTMEAELGLTLFQRNSFHGIELTESGKIMMDAFIRSKKEILAAHEKAHLIETEARVQLTLGLLEGQLLDGPFEELIAGFRLSYPNITINIRRDTYISLINALSADEIHIIYMPEWQFTDTSHLVVQFIGVMETQLVVPKRLFPEVEDRIYSLAEFTNIPFITVNDSESSASKNMLLDLFKDLAISPPIYETGSIREQIGMVEIGEGLILINPNNSICYSPNVHCIKIKELKAQPFAIAWKRNTSEEGILLFSKYLQTIKSRQK